MGVWCEVLQLQKQQTKEEVSMKWMMFVFAAESLVLLCSMSILSERKETSPYAKTVPCPGLSLEGCPNE